MDKIDITKKIATFIVGVGTGKIAGAIISNNISPDGIIEKVTVVSAAFVIGAMAGDATKQYTGAKIDEAVAFVNQIRSERKAA
jgi:hypothetical protein